METTHQRLSQFNQKGEGMEQIKKILLEMETECFSGVHYPCSCCSDSLGRDGATRKVIQILPYWDKIMEIVQNPTRRTNRNADK